MAGASTSVRGGSLAPERAAPALALATALLAAAVLLGWVIVSRPDLYRPLFAVGIVTVLGLAALRWPNPAILATLLFLPVLGLLRRLLIESTGWPEADPLLLIGPALAVVLFVKAYVLESHPLATDLLSKLVLAFVVLVVLGVVNPLGAGLEAGAAGLMLTGIPLLWFFVGRALPDRVTMKRLLYGSAFLAGVVAIYGLAQTEVGFPRWDLEWISVGGFSSLSVGDEVRGFGSMASASEYAAYLGIGMVIATAALLHRRAWPLMLLPILCVGILFSSTRSTMVVAIVAIVVLLGVRSRRPQTALPAIAAAALLVYFIAAPLLVSASSNTRSDLVSHQLEGIARPFDEDTSTLSAHLMLATNGIAEGVRQPFGHGATPAALASDDLSYTGGGTEFDLSNAFVSFGLFGGIVFLALTVGAVLAAGRSYTRTHDVLHLATLGVVVVTFGIWLNGGHYAVTPLLWLILGWATRPSEGGGQTASAPSSP